MKINNINNNIRESIYKAYTEGFEFKSREFRDMMLNLKTIDYKKYFDLLCCLYPVFYTMNEERTFNKAELDAIMADDLADTGFEEDEIEEELVELDEVDSIYIYDLSGVMNTQDLMNFFENEPDALCEVLICTCLFHRSDYFQKRRILTRMIGFDEYFLKFNPTYWMDKIEYTHTIDKNEFIEMVDEKVNASKEDIPMRFKRIGNAGELLVDLEESDFANYESLVNEIYTDSYKYQKFLLLNRLVNKDNEFVLSNIETIENVDMLDSPYFLDVNLDYFFSFHSKCNEFKEEVYKYFDKNKEQNKIKIKSTEQQ